MNENQKNSADALLENSMSAANAVNGAAKTGKAASQIAKGAAAGGPYGAIAGAVWESRNVIGKIIIAVIALLMIPVVYVMMLPSLIFGGLTDTFSPADTENPILNSNTAVAQSLNAICDAVDAILAESLNNTVAEIYMNFESSEADQIDVINPYETQVIYDVHKLVSMYCAAKGNDYGSVSVNDMAQILRDHMDMLYTYSFTEEIRPVMQTDPETGELVPVTETDPDTGEEVAVTEVWRIYSISFDGEAYFENQIFCLTEEQKKLANDYYQNLNLFLRDENFANITNPSDNSNP